jgi:hypothetical protein
MTVPSLPTRPKCAQAANLLTKDEARRMAADGAKLPNMPSVQFRQIS